MSRQEYTWGAGTPRRPATSASLLRELPLTLLERQWNPHRRRRAAGVVRGCRRHRDEVERGGLAGLDLPLPRLFVHLADSVLANPR